MDSYYEILGIPTDASQDEVKRAFRKLAIQWHPDKNPGNPDAEEQFKRIVIAYEVLSDNERRKSYDLGSTINIFPFNIDLDNAEEIFSKMFASMFGDYLDERIPGGFRERVNRAASASRFKSSQKSEATQKTQGCKQCGGRGRVQMRQGGVCVYMACRACKR